MPIPILRRFEKIRPLNYKRSAPDALDNQAFMILMRSLKGSN